VAHRRAKLTVCLVDGLDHPDVVPGVRRMVPAPGPKEIVETKQNNIVINDVTDVGIQNQQYLESKIKNRIETTEKMLTNFEALIELNKDNANMIPRMYEVYANLTNSISLLLREMRELSKMRIGIDLVIADNVIKSKKG